MRRGASAARSAAGRVPLWFLTGGTARLKRGGNWAECEAHRERRHDAALFAAWCWRALGRSCKFGGCMVALFATMRPPNLCRVAQTWALARGRLHGPRWRGGEDATRRAKTRRAPFPA